MTRYAPGQKMIYCSGTLRLIAKIAMSLQRRDCVMATPMRDLKLDSAGAGLVGRFRF